MIHPSRLAAALAAAALSVASVTPQTAPAAPGDTPQLASWRDGQLYGRRYHLDERPGSGPSRVRPRPGWPQQTERLSRPGVGSCTRGTRLTQRQAEFCARLGFDRRDGPPPQPLDPPRPGDDLPYRNDGQLRSPPPR